MNNYLETHYFKNETDETAYPQLLCDYISERYFSKNGCIEGKRLLDIGSGKGNHLGGFSRLGIDVHGIDKREECLIISKKYIVKYCDIEKEPFPFENNFFDLIFSKSVLEHVTNTNNFLLETFRVLKPGGICVLMVPDWKTQYKFFWDDYTHLTPFTRKGLRNALCLNGFQNVECSYFLQLPLVWKHGWLKHLASVVALLPDSLKWRNNDEKDFRSWIRFSKEKMLLAVGSK